MAKKKQQREYTLSDLSAMVDQLGGRLHMEILPEELHRINGEVVNKCDYCGTSQHDAYTLVRSPSGRVHICAACVSICVEVVAEYAVKTGTKPPSRNAEAPPVAEG